MGISMNQVQNGLDNVLQAIINMTCFMDDD